MNLREFYEKNDVDYDVFLQRMMGKESLIEKYLRIFMNDPTYRELEQAILSQDYETVGFKAHTMKGIALNLNLETLGRLCMNMVSSVRNGDTLSLTTQFQQVKEEYTHIMDELGN